jgi:hypothetical protein
MFVHHMRAPLGRHHPDHNKYAVVLGAFEAKPVGGRRKGAASLDRSCARRPPAVWVGAKKRLQGRTKKLNVQRSKLRGRVAQMNRAVALYGKHFTSAKSPAVDATDASEHRTPAWSASRHASALATPGTTLAGSLSS